MNVTLAYRGRSELRPGAGGRVLSLAPNLSREAVAFDAPLAAPLRFREAISALHDVVVSDLRFRKRDKTAYQQWKANEQRRLNELRRAEHDKARDEALQLAGRPVPRDLERQYDQCRQRYWDARRAYDRYLRQHDPELWRQIMPYDPVITVADDVVFFECFSGDESSYGCLTVDREAFGRGGDGGVRLGTTNVDYSWDLYHHFQSLRSYRETRLSIDPEGFEVATGDAGDAYREEKIDLPTSWLRGFMQMQGVAGMPMRRVTLTPAAVYSLIAWLKRHRAKQSPRAIRFELLDGRAPRLVIEPWEREIVSHGSVYRGPEGEAIRIWGRRRLSVLARALPLADAVDVCLLGTGLPSFWLVRMGEMTLTVGLSGWTRNDWTRSAALDLLAPPVEPDGETIDAAAGVLQSRRSGDLASVARQVNATPARTAAALNYLANAGQVIFDIPRAIYRWRRVLPVAIGESEIGPPNAELVAARQMLRAGKVKLSGVQEPPRGGQLLTGAAGDQKEVEVLIDGDGIIRRGRCQCSHHFRFGIRTGPCRHLLALRSAAMNRGRDDATPESWYNRLRTWAGT